MNTTHTLLATTGASPQVITETLYAIHHAQQPWPQEIFLITTSFGKRKAMDGLLTQGHLQRLCTQLQQPLPAFTEAHILVAPGADGIAVEDARSIADHEALANFIMTEVRNRTAQPNNHVHASLAGGRKTMTFYMGYAMSLFGRVQDTLSHVLVSEGYENNPDFWFPTDAKELRYLPTREQKILDASLAEVTLAPIPFVRHRHNLPEILLQSSTQSAVNFSELVQLINLAESPESLRLYIDLSAKTIRLQDNTDQVSLVFELGLLDLAFYSRIAKATMHYQAPEGLSKEELKKYLDEHLIRRPAATSLEEKNKKSKNWLQNQKSAFLYVQELLQLCGLHSQGSLQADIDQLKAWNDDRKKSIFKENTLLSLESNGMSDSWFDSRKNSIYQLFSEKLPPKLINIIIPSTIYDGKGQKLMGEKSDATPKGGGYGIKINPQHIKIEEI